ADGGARLDSRNQPAAPEHQPQEDDEKAVPRHLAESKESGGGLRRRLRPQANKPSGGEKEETNERSTSPSRKDEEETAGPPMLAESKTS
ncbi:unnamed protein product, partial [Ectocarpus sp. 12 AP-2014]